MNPAKMLADQMGGVLLPGWAAHFMIGTILAVIYAIVAPWLPGPPAGARRAVRDRSAQGARSHSQ